MSIAFGRKITQDSGGPRKCRIPQRVCSGTHRLLSKPRDTPQVSPRLVNNEKIPKSNDVKENNNKVTASRSILCIETQEHKIPNGTDVYIEEHLPKEQKNELDLIEAEINPNKLKESWKLKKEQFEKMRVDLKERQGTIMEVYADLKTAEEKLVLLGQKISSQAVENDLQVMNVAKLTPRQLLELCGETKSCNGDVAAAYFKIDVKKMSNIPSRVFETCEEMLQKHKELLDWLENLQLLNENDLLHSSKRRNINDFKLEYDTLNDKVQAVKTELGKNLMELTDVIRKCVKETMEVSKRNKDLTNELSRLNSKNSLPLKPINDKDSVIKLHLNKIKIEELEKKIKEEKLKNITTRERIKKFESEAKMNENRANHLEVALEQAREENRNLERTIQNEQNQNQQSQQEFNDKLRKLMSSIEENSKNIEKIDLARNKLQKEKEELLIKLNFISDEKMKLQNIVQTQQSEILQKDEQYKQIFKTLQYTQLELAEALKYGGNGDQVPQLDKNLDDTKTEIEILNKKIIEKNKLIEGMTERLEATKTLGDQLRNEIEQKAEQIEDQQKKYIALQNKSKESELKMQLYERQLMTHEEEIKNVKKKYKDHENLDMLNSTVTEQKLKIQKLTQRNDELTSALHKQAIEIKSCMHTILTQEEQIKEKDALLIELSENKTKQSTTIKSLQRDVASQVNETDRKMSGNLHERIPEVENLIVDIQTKQNRISEMEKVMIALYDHARKTRSKNKKYREKNQILKQVISGYETYIDNINVESPSGYLDGLRRILENEVETPIYARSCRHNFITDDFNRSRKILHSERVPRCILTRKKTVNDRSSNRAEPLLDGHLDKDQQGSLRVTL